MNARIRNNYGEAALSSMGYLALMVLLVLVAASLFAPLRSWRKLNRALYAAQMRLDELQVLYPLYTELAGMDKAKALQKLNEFRSGAKPASIMHQISKGFTDEQLDLMATFFAAQKN